MSVQVQLGSIILPLIFDFSDSRSGLGLAVLSQGLSGSSLGTFAKLDAIKCLKVTECEHV